MVYAQHRICPGKYYANTNFGFWETNIQNAEKCLGDLKLTAIQAHAGAKNSE